jgi:hypothetical protein
MAATGAWPACGGKKSRSWPVSVLQLDDAERAHPFDLIRAANTSTPPPSRPPARQQIRRPSSASSTR